MTSQLPKKNLIGIDLVGVVFNVDSRVQGLTRLTGICSESGVRSSAELKKAVPEFAPAVRLFSFTAFRDSQSSLPPPLIQYAKRNIAALAAAQYSPVYISSRKDPDREGIIRYSRELNIDSLQVHLTNGQCKASVCSALGVTAMIDNDVSKLVSLPVYFKIAYGVAHPRGARRVTRAYEASLYEDSNGIFYTPPWDREARVAQAIVSIMRRNEFAR